MRLHLIRLGSGLIALALTAGAPRNHGAGPLPASTADAMAQVSPAVARISPGSRNMGRARIRGGRRTYWASITEKRRGRNINARSPAITLDDYVLTHPPLYTGPKRPVDP
jgi:hypothetical protein